MSNKRYEVTVFFKDKEPLTFLGVLEWSVKPTHLAIKHTHSENPITDCFTNHAYDRVTATPADSGMDQFPSASEAKGWTNRTE